MDQTYWECIKLMNICQKVVPNVSEVEKSGKAVRWRTRMLYKVHKNVVQGAQAQDVAHDAQAQDALAQDVVPNVSEVGKSGKVVRGGTQPYCTVRDQP